MDNNLHTRPLQAASVALMVALTGCAVHAPEPSMTEGTRNRLAQALQASGDQASAAALLQAQDPKTNPDPLLHIKALIAAGELDQAMTAAKSAVATHGDDLALALDVGRLAVQADRLPEAGEFYLHASVKNPGNIDAMNGQGVVMAQQGDLNNAANLFRKALAKHPKDPTSSNNLALTMILRGEPDAALSILQDIDRSGGSPQIKATLAFARDRLGSNGGRQPVAVAEQLLSITTAPRAPILAREPLAPVGQPISAPLMRPQPAAAVPRPYTAGGERIVLRARSTSWLQVRDADDQILLSRELRQGETWSVPSKPGLMLVTGNAGGTELLVDGVVAAPLGGPGMIRRDVMLDPDAIKDGKLPAQIRAARVAGTV